MQHAGVHPPTRRFVGRHRERILLRHLVRAAGEGRPGLVLVSGPAGVGKTALLRWLVREAGTAKVLTSYQSCSEHLQPAELFRTVLEPLAIGPIDWHPLLQQDDPAAALTRAVTEALIGAGRRRPVLLALDDAHELGLVGRQVTLALAATLEHTASAAGVHALLALSVRGDVDTGHAFDDLLRMEITRDLPLAGLSPQEVADLVLASGGRLGAFGDLHGDTGGLPLLVESAVDAGPRGLRVRTLDDALHARFDKVDRVTREVLTVAAVLGDPWDPGEVQATGTSTADDLIAAIDAAVAARLIEAGGPGWRFAHPLLRTSLVNGLDAPECEAIHLRAARALARVADPSTDRLVRVAHHLVAAASQVPSSELADVAGRAGEYALVSGAWELAAHLLGAAADAGAHEPPPSLARRHLLAGRAAYMAHDPIRAERYLGRAVFSGEGTQLASLRLEAATLLARTRLSERPFQLGRRSDVSELIDALRADDLDPSAVVTGRAVLAEALLVSGESDRAFDLVAAARARDVPAAGDAAVGELELSEGIHRLSRLELVQAEECFVRAERLATKADDEHSEICASIRRRLVELLHGEVTVALAGAAELRTRATDAGLFGEAAIAAAVVAIGSSLMGGHSAAHAVDEAARLWRRSGYDFAAVLAAPAASALEARGGPSASEAWTLADGATGSTIEVLRAAEAGDATAVRAHLATASWRQGLRGPPALGTTAILAAMVEAASLLEESELAARALPGLEALAGAGVCVIAGWPCLVSRLLGTAARISGDLGAAHAHLEHAASLSRRHRLAYEHARVELELARLAHGRGQEQEAIAHVTLAVRTFDEMEMSVWLARIDAMTAALSMPPLLGTALPARDRTILTTDIVGSTGTNARLGDALYVEQLRVHDRLFRSRLAELRGTEIKHTGDGFNAFFDDPGDAIRCALAFQDDLAEWARVEPELALAARCGAATGQTVPTGGDLHGLLQAQAARICAAAAPGEVVTSSTTAALVADQGFVITSRGRHQLKGLPEAIEILQVRQA